MARPISDKVLNLENAKTKHPDLCNRFRQCRIDFELTQEEFAAILKITTSLVKQIEQGRNAPTIEILRKLKTSFNLSYDYLIDGNSDN